MIRNLTSLALLAALCMALAGPAQAGLMLQVDTSAETYRLTGSTTLQPFIGDESDFASWVLSGGGGFGASTLFDNTIASSTPNILALSRLRLFDNATDLILDWGVANTPSQEISGNGTAYSYAGATPTQKAYLQSIIGQSLLPQFGLVADPVAIVREPNTVPEPSSLALWGMGILLIIRRRRLRW